MFQFILICKQQNKHIRIWRERKIKNRKQKYDQQVFHISFTKWIYIISAYSMSATFVPCEWNWKEKKKSRLSFFFAPYIHSNELKALRNCQHNMEIVSNWKKKKEKKKKRCRQYWSIHSILLHVEWQTMHNFYHSKYILSQLSFQSAHTHIISFKASFKVKLVQLNCIRWKMAIEHFHH